MKNVVVKFAADTVEFGALGTVYLKTSDEVLLKKIQEITCHIEMARYLDANKDKFIEVYTPFQEEFIFISVEEDFKKRLYNMDLPMETLLDSQAYKKATAKI